MLTPPAMMPAVGGRIHQPDWPRSVERTAIFRGFRDDIATSVLTRSVT